ncbi:MAG TPA: oligosaccharide flippase family protein [Pseudomonadales bacterium]|nr:oligosaccharide flippase family protein [Pseudomonadales bacterium]
MMLNSNLFKSALFKRLLVGSFWSVLGVASEKAITLASIIVVVRILGKENFGLFAILQSTLVMAGSFASLGLGVTATKHIAELRFNDPARLARILAMTQRFSFGAGLVLFIVLSVASPFICLNILHQPELVQLLRLGAIAVVFNTIDGYQNGALLGFESVRKSAVGYFSAALLGAPVSILLAHWFGIQGAVIGLVATALIRFFISTIILRDCLKAAGIVLDHQRWQLELGLFTRFALPSFISGLVIAPAHWLCHMMLINSSGGKAEMAVLGVANQWYYSALFIPLAANRVLLPVITDLFSQRGNASSNRVAILSVCANLAAMTPAVLFIWLISPWIMAMYGADYVAHAQVLVAAVAAAAVASVLMPLGHVLTSRGKMWVGLRLNSMWALSYISATYYLLDKGALGVMSGLLSAYVLHGMVTALTVWFGVFRPEGRAPSL